MFFVCFKTFYNGFYDEGSNYLHANHSTFGKDI